MISLIGLLFISMVKIFKCVLYSLETRGTLLLGSHTARALVVDMALVSVGEMTL